MTILSLLLIPLYLYSNNTDMIRDVNNRFVKLISLPASLGLTLLFALFALLMVPFAYLYALYGKWQLLCKKRPKTEDYSREKSNTPKMKVKNRSKDAIAKDLLLFLVLGIPILLVSWLLDCYTFLVKIYRDDIISYEDAANHDYVMNEEQFAELEAFCKQEMRMMVMASYNKVATK